MSLKIATTTFDCADARALAEFWAQALGYTVGEGGDEYLPIAGDGPGLAFVRVPEGKSVKNRVHLDLVTDDRETEVDRLQGLGASVARHVRQDDGTIGWTVMTDPEGNEFCVVPQ